VHDAPSAAGLCSESDTGEGSEGKGKGEGQAAKGEEEAHAKRTDQCDTHTHTRGPLFPFLCLTRGRVTAEIGRHRKLRPMISGTQIYLYVNMTRLRATLEGLLFFLRWVTASLWLCFSGQQPSFLPSADEARRQGEGREGGREGRHAQGEEEDGRLCVSDASVLLARREATVQGSNGGPLATRRQPRRCRMQHKWKGG
jgi:hypothetical protein